MELGIVGMGRMGANMARRLIRAGHRVVVYDQDQARVGEMAGEGAIPTRTLNEFALTLGQRKIGWIMLPAGKITDQVIETLGNQFISGDILIDGGNSHYLDDIRRAKALSERGIQYLDVGVSGGVWGLERGYCLMVGGTPESFARLEPVFKALAPGDQGIPSIAGAKSASPAVQGYLHCGPVGSGHFAKMVHNGIEYGMMQALAEGFDILRGSPFPFKLEEVSEVWRRGSVISSWLLDLSAAAFNQDPTLSKFEGHVPDSGEGRWTLQAALEAGVPAEVISAALNVRFRSRNSGIFSQKVLSAMRNEFGGHQEEPPNAGQKKAS